MIYSVTFSKPTSLVKEKFGRQYIRVKIRMTNETSDDKKYFAEFFTENQSFHEHFSASQLDNFISENAGKIFRNCVVFTETEEITTMASKKGKITRLAKKIKTATPSVANSDLSPSQTDGGGRNSAGKNSGLLNNASPTEKSQEHNSQFSPSRKIVNIRMSDGKTQIYGNNRQKNYILKEGVVVPFLVELGVMSREGKVIAAKYDKFRQINRFLEFINDILPELVAENTRPLRIVDFGSGKSYLTFATHYFLTEIKKLQVEIVGLDLKKDVIAKCTTLAEKLGCAGLSFQVGDIADYSVANENDAPDLMISLHACDTATDYALAFAIKHKCKAILSVPCCQHETNKQLEKNKKTPPEFAPLLKYGILRERFAALATDALRAEYLEEAGYNVQLLEFIDMEHTPKNILIRAVRRKSPVKKSGASSELIRTLQLETTLGKLIAGE